ncbi:hypothetical protein CMI40_00940 [Candidatus Pacearchaeota archaeon]|jgi:hypothetical protein|nr:hypothetical protein [Candidatus Pacearchaeota archaeon]|tara:strand:- start:7479 stop:8051 length:573 start_codon:yes stop_codon:yes gene_type:complete
MRKIVSEKEINKNKRIKQYTVGGILIFIMLFSTLGFAFMGNTDTNTKKVIYNNLEFINLNNLWILNNGGIEFVFKYNPRQIDFEEINGLKYIENYYGKPLYIYPGSRETELEISRNFYQIVQRIQPACLRYMDCDENIPEKTCRDNLIIIEENINKKIIQEDNCVIIMGPRENLTKIIDEFLFNIFNIKE